mmetsp:Transcript_1402/g.3485  ORF Transcript_1402/g.3485 Transcript_1402/m.3485 type:complete len:100 (+) Transcript_1402:279-578(+)
MPLQFQGLSDKRTVPETNTAKGGWKRKMGQIESRRSGSSFCRSIVKLTSVAARQWQIREVSSDKLGGMKGYSGANLAKAEDRQQHDRNELCSVWFRQIS